MTTTRRTVLTAAAAVPAVNKSATVTPFWQSVSVWNYCNIRALKGVTIGADRDPTQKEN